MRLFFIVGWCFTVLFSSDVSARATVVNDHRPEKAPNLDVMYRQWYKQAVTSANFLAFEEAIVLTELATLSGSTSILLLELHAELCTQTRRYTCSIETYDRLLRLVPQEPRYAQMRSVAELLRRAQLLRRFR